MTKGQRQFLMGEGWRNLRCSGGTALVMGLLTLFGLALPAIADVLAVGRLVTLEQEWEAAGGRVLIASSAHGVPAQACARLSLVDGIVGSVALSRDATRVGFTAAPGVDLPLIPYTGELGGVIGDTVPPTSMGISRETGSRLGLGRESWVRISPAQAAVPDLAWPVRPLNLDVLPEQFRVGVLVAVSAPRSMDACVLRIQAGSEEGVRAALPTLLASSNDAPLVIAERLVSGQFSSDPSRDYRLRPSRWMPIAGGLVIGLAWLLLRWLSRSSDALYGTLGFSTRHRFVVHLTYWLLLSGIGVVAALLCGGVVLLAVGGPTEGLWPHLARAVSMSWASATSLVCLTPLLSPPSLLASLKDR